MLDSVNFNVVCLEGTMRKNRLGILVVCYSTETSLAILACESAVQYSWKRRHDIQYTDATGTREVLLENPIFLSVHRFRNGKDYSTALPCNINAGSGWASIYGIASQDNFGCSVAVSGNGDRMIVGAPGHDIDEDTTPFSLSESGLARVFELSRAQCNSWLKVGSDITGDAEQDEAGGEVAISKDGKIVAVGSPNYLYVRPNGWKMLSTGRVRVYNVKNISWDKLGQDVYGPGDASYDFGRCISLLEDGRYMAVGDTGRHYHGPFSDDTVGNVRVFKFDSDKNDWDQIGNPIEGNGATTFSGGPGFNNFVSFVF